MSSSNEVCDLAMWKSLVLFPNAAWMEYESKSLLGSGRIKKHIQGDQKEWRVATVPGRVNVKGNRDEKIAKGDMAPRERFS